MTPQDYLKKCLELSEKASKPPWVVTASYDPMVRTNSPNGYGIRASQTDAELIAFSRTALPKVCEALRIAMEEFERITMLVAEMKETKPTESVLVAEACQGIANSAVHMINKLFDDADNDSK